MGLDMWLKIVGQQNIPVRENGLTKMGSQTWFATWRKANAIHSWFVKNVQGGNDDCGSYEVSKVQLDQLLKDCKKVRAAYHGKMKKVIASLLPTQEGFFFGSTAYDESYLENIEHTIEVLQEVLSNFDSESNKFYYMSSW